MTTTRREEDVKTNRLHDYWTHADLHHEDLDYYVHHTRRRYFTTLFAVGALSAIVFSALTWAIVSSRPVRVTFALPSQPPTNVVASSTPTVNLNSLGQAAIPHIPPGGYVRFATKVDSRLADGCHKVAACQFLRVPARSLNDRVARRCCADQPRRREDE